MTSSSTTTRGVDAELQTLVGVRHTIGKPGSSREHHAGQDAAERSDARAIASTRHRAAQSSCGRSPAVVVEQVFERLVDVVGLRRVRR